MTIPLIDVRDDAARLISRTAEYYALADPVVTFRAYGTVIDPPRTLVPTPGAGLPAGWHAAEHPDFDSIHWYSSSGPAAATDPRRHGLVAVNGFWVHDGRSRDVDAGGAYNWSSESLARALWAPTLSLFDSQHRLGLNLHRYSLLERELPFEQELLAAIASDVVAHGRTHGPVRHPLGRAHTLQPVRLRNGWMPLLPQLIAREAAHLLIVWRESPRGGRKGHPEATLRALDTWLGICDAAVRLVAHRDEPGSLAKWLGARHVVSFQALRADRLERGLPSGKEGWKRMASYSSKDVRIFVRRDTRASAGGRKERAGISASAASWAEKAAPVLKDYAVRRGGVTITVMTGWNPGGHAGSGLEPIAAEWMDRIGGVLTLGTRSDGCP